MAANTSTNLVSLDFATYKASLKSYLQNNPLFRDYDYEGSNISLLLDLLAYNTFQNAFYLNMVMSESFLDSAQLRSSIVSHAKDLNYLPTSARSAKASVTVDFTASGENQPYLIPKGSPFSVLIKTNEYTFTTPENILCSSGNTSFSFTTDIYEGLYVTDSYVMSASNEIQRFRITNQTVDTSSISVTVYEDGSELGDSYQATDTLLGLEPTSKVFFVQATHDGYYEILFGDNIFGRKPKAQSLIAIQYRTTVGFAANGAKKFDCGFDPTGAGQLLSTPVTTLISQAADGSDKQSSESIRTLAPRYFATQQRAVASDDYSSLILAKFPGQVDDVIVFGGETLNPRQYGRVVVGLKPKSGIIAPNFLKEEVISTMLKYVSIPTRVIIMDPEYFYLKIDSTVQYDKTATTKQPSEITGIIRTAINDFGTDNLERFGRDFRYSRFVSAIDNADESIVSNDTKTWMLKRLTPKLLYSTDYSIDFGNALCIEAAHAGQPITQAKFEDTPSVYSTAFSYVDLANETTYPNSYLLDDNQGNLAVYTYVSGVFTVINDSIGTVNYETGEITITNLIVADYDNHISLCAKMRNKDVIINKQNLLFIELEDVSVTLIDQNK